MSTPSIQLNGAPHPLSAATTVTELLQSLGMANKPVVIELDGRALTPADHATAIIHPGARVELITLAAGG